MNADHQNNLDDLANSVMTNFYTAWSYLHVLQGITAGSRRYPAVVKDFDLLLSQAYRAMFDGLLARAATLIDRTPATQSLPNFIKLAKKYGDDELQGLARNIECELYKPGGSFKKLEAWRNKVVAHNTHEGREASFYEQNKMSLGEIDDALAQLEKMLNRVSLPSIRVHHEAKSGTEHLEDDGLRLFAKLAA